MEEPPPVRQNEPAATPGGRRSLAHAGGLSYAVSFGGFVVRSANVMITSERRAWHPSFRTIGKQYRRFGQTPWGLSFMSCSCAAHYSVWNPLGAAGQS
jgi:hypothetical protein